MIRNPTLAFVAIAATAACQQSDPHDAVPSGRTLYLANCASCHGESGRGDGPRAADLSRSPTDLTARTDLDEPLSILQVMSYAHGGLREGQSNEVMPAFGETLDGPVVLYDSGDGSPTPTPLPLIKVAEYVRSLQDG